MDITNMDAQSRNPVFEWAIENPRYSNSNATLIRWGKAASSRGVYTMYSDLGLTLNPGVYFTPANSGGQTVGVLPGGLGHNFGSGNDTQGRAFYIFNPTDGSLLHTIFNENSGFLCPTNSDRVGMGISPIVYQENSAKETIAFYTADSDGNIFKCDTTVGFYTQWKMKSFFQFQTIGKQFENNVGNPVPAGKTVVVPRRMLLARAKPGQLWLFGGTSDLHGPGSYENDSRKIINLEQFLFGLHTNRITASIQQNYRKITPGDTDIRQLPYYVDDIPAEYGRYGRPYSPNTNTGINFGMNDFGWVLRLRPKFGTTEAEYLSADPVLLNDVLYFATFIPRSGLRSQEACSNVGVGKLYALDPSTGHSLLSNGPAIVLDNVKISGMTGNSAENRLTLSIKELKPQSAQSIRAKFNNVVELASGLIEITAPLGSINNPGGEPDLDFEEIVPHVQYWRDKF